MKNKMSPKKPELTLTQRAQIIDLNRQGKSQIKIAQIIKCSRCAVQTTIKRFAETNTLESRPRRGSKRKTTPRLDRKLVSISLRNRKKTSSELASELETEDNVKISSSTVRRRLLEAGLHGCKARKKPLLSVKNVKKRLEWAKIHQNWTSADWAKVLWSDECNIEVSLVG